MPAMICRPQAWNSPGKSTPAVVVVPPSWLPASTSTVRAPNLPAWIAAIVPAVPPPITRTSAVIWRMLAAGESRASGSRGERHPTRGHDSDVGEEPAPGDLAAIAAGVRTNHGSRLPGHVACGKLGIESTPFIEISLSVHTGEETRPTTTSHYCEQREPNICPRHSCRRRCILPLTPWRQPRIGSVHPRSAQSRWACNRQIQLSVEGGRGLVSSSCGSWRKCNTQSPSFDGGRGDVQRGPLALGASLHCPARGLNQRAW